MTVAGLASGEGVPVDKPFWTELRADAGELMLAHQAGKKPV